MRTPRPPEPGPVPGERLYCALLRLHPRAFRLRFEDELVACFREAWHAEARGRGVRVALAFWLRAALGAVATAWRQRVDERDTGHETDTGFGATGHEEGTMATRRTRLDDRLQDARFALRMLRRSPGFAAAVLLTLGLSIGAAGAVYTVVDGVLLQPLPYPEAEELYRVGQDGDAGSYWLSTPNYEDIKNGLGAFAAMGAYTPDGANMVVEGEPTRVSVAEADAAFFATLGLEPLLGRTYTEAERAAGARVVVISHDLWIERMGGRPDAIGQTLVLDGSAREVIGVLPAGPTVPSATDVWIPLITDSPEWRTRRGISWIQVVGRLRAGAEMDALRAEAGALSASLRETFPDTNANLEIGLRSLEEATIGTVRTELRLLMAAVGLALLVSAINVGGLLLARATSRQGEVAVRAALGGGRRRIAAQMLTESAVLALLGCALGVVFGWIGLAGLLAAAPPGTPRLEEVAMGAPTMRFVLAAGLAAALIFGVVPALAALRHPAGAIHTTRSGGGKRATRLRGGLVVAQVALSLSLLFGAGLLGKSFWHLQQVDFGFEPEGVLVAGLPIDDSDFDSAQEREAYYDAILERARTLPGVARAALTSSAPFAGFGVVFTYDLLDRPADPDEQRLARFRVVTHELFSTLGIPLLAGRTFTPEETVVGGSRGAVVSHDLARRHYPDADPLGRRLTIAGDTFDIVGVVPALRDVSAREPSPFPFVYVPVMPAVRQSMTLVVRAERDPAALVEPVRLAVRELAPAQPVTPLRPLPELVAESAARPRFTLQLLTFFAAATLLLSGVGLYGLLAHAVGRRTREIGVRVALGSPVGQVRALVMRQGLTLAAVGLALGIVLAAWGGRFLESLLFEVDARDPSVLAGVALTLLGVAVLASWFPARRATRIAPVEALRAE